MLSNINHDNSALSIIGSMSDNEPVCMVCWESSSAANPLVRACGCKDARLSYAHTDCLTQWVNTTNNTKCAVCLTSYEITYEALPITTVLNRHGWLLFSFLGQLVLPLSLYVVLFAQGKLVAANRLIVGAHATLMIIMYVYFGKQIFSKIKLYHRRASGQNEEALLKIPAAGRV